VIPKAQEAACGGQFAAPVAHIPRNYVRVQRDRSSWVALIRKSKRMTFDSCVFVGRDIMAEVYGEGGELLFDLGAGEGLAVSGSKDARAKEREAANGEGRVIPVGREVGRRSVQLGRLSDSGVEEGLWLGGAEGIADDECAIGSAEKGDVAGRVSGSVHDLPVGENFDFLFAVDEAKAGGEVHGTTGVERREQRHHASACAGVGGRVFLFASEVRGLKLVRVDGNVPVIGELAGGADVIEVSVGKDDGQGRSGEVLLSPVANQGGGVREASVNEGPTVIGVADSEDVHERDAKAFDAFGYVIDGDCGVLRNFSLRHLILLRRRMDPADPGGSVRVAVFQMRNAGRREAWSRKKGGGSRGGWKDSEECRDCGRVVVAGGRRDVPRWPVSGRFVV
jgi:hypothetical protein